MNVYQLLEVVRKDPAFYFENQKSLKMLRAFLAGYEAGIFEVGKNKSTLGELRPFNSWVAKQLGFSSSTSGWCNMIQSKSSSDEQAFDMFFELLDKFRSETNS